MQPVFSSSQVLRNPEHPLIGIVSEFGGIGDIQSHVQADAFLVDAAVGQAVGDGHGDQVRMAAER